MEIKLSACQKKAKAGQLVSMGMAEYDIGKQ
jgi:hypothetical protein